MGNSDDEKEVEKKKTGKKKKLKKNNSKVSNEGKKTVDPVDKLGTLLEDLSIQGSQSLKNNVFKKGKEEKIDDPKTPIKSKISDSKSSDSETEDLLYYDHTSDEDDEDRGIFGNGILGASFNIPYTYKDQNGKKHKKFIPGNKIHKELAANENFFRTKMYENRKGDKYYSKYFDKKYNNKSFIKYYTDKEEAIIENQDIVLKTKQEKKTFKNYEAFKEKQKNNNGKEDYQKIKDTKKYKDFKKRCENDLYKIESPYVSFAKAAETKKSANIYPNFATAKLSYIDENGKLKSKFLYVSDKKREIKGSPSDYLQGHSEAQIFRQAKKKIEGNDKFKNSELIILDIHTTMSTCNSCYTEANDFIDELKNDYKIKVNISYSFPYGSVPTDEKKGLYQKQIQIVKNQNSSIMKDGILFPSSGYLNSPVKDTIDKMRDPNSSISVSPNAKINNDTSLRERVKNKKVKKGLFKDDEKHQANDSYAEEELPGSNNSDFSDADGSG